MSKPLNVLLVETFYGGSHAAFANGLISHSRHRIELVSLPAREWRWRTRVAAFEIASMLPDPGRFDLVFVTDLINLADLRALWGKRCPAVLLYVHESQLTYPHPKDRNPDMNTAIQDIKNCLVADRVLFNSRFHRDAFLAEIGRVQARISSERPLEWQQPIADKSEVLYPGIDTDLTDSSDSGHDAQPSDHPVRGSVPRVLWNHRWEYDKQPRPFFRSLSKLAEESLAFEVVLVGENPQVSPTEFLRGRELLGDRIVQWGYADSRREYRQWLQVSDIVVSTAIQENFGIAMVEAIIAGCTPLLPRRLSYPEVIPEPFHDRVLYDSEADLTKRLRELLQPDRVGPIRVEGLSQAMTRYGWNSVIDDYDREMEATAEISS